MTAQRKLTRAIKLFTALAMLLSALAYTKPVLAQSTCESPVAVSRGDTLFKIASRCDTTVDALVRANPEIKDRNKIFVGQKIVLPGALIPGSGTTDTYIVVKGDSLLSLSKRFETTVARLLELNPEITNQNVIYAGQRLQVPKTDPPTPPPAPQTYMVVRGDTLRSIAARFDTTVEALLKLNPAIKDPNKIYVGQKLVLPEPVQLYTVVRGDTLRIIASRFDTTVQELLKLNPGIKDANIIYVGQVLRVR